MKRRTVLLFLEYARKAALRIQDDIESMYLFRLSTWAMWQKILVAYAVMIGVLFIIAITLLMPKWHQRNLLQTEINSLRENIAKVDVIQELERLPLIPNCEIEGFADTSLFLVERANNQLSNGDEESNFLRRVAEDGNEVIEVEFASEFGELKQLLSCVARDEKWKLTKWYLQRATDNLVVVRLAIS